MADQTLKPQDEDTGGWGFTEGAEHGPAGVDQLDLAVPGEGLRISGQTGRIPPVIAGELARQVGRGLGKGACMVMLRRFKHLPPVDMACAGMCGQTQDDRRLTQEQRPVCAIPRVRCCLDRHLGLQKHKLLPSALHIRGRYPHSVIRI